MHQSVSQSVGSLMLHFIPSQLVELQQSEVKQSKVLISASERGARVPKSQSVSQFVCVDDSVQCVCLLVAVADIAQRKREYYVCQRAIIDCWN